MRDSRRRNANKASASARSAPVGAFASTSTRSPCASHSLAVAGPIAATIVAACGLPAMPTKLRTELDEENSTASYAPALIPSRMTAGGGAARTVRNAVTVSYTHLRAHETVLDLVCRLL